MIERFTDDTTRHAKEITELEVRFKKEDDELKRIREDLKGNLGKTMKLFEYLSFYRQNARIVRRNLIHIESTRTYRIYRRDKVRARGRF